MFLLMRCWCGNDTLSPFCDGYSHCDACQTLVSRGMGRFESEFMEPRLQQKSQHLAVSAFAGKEKAWRRISYFFAGFPTASGCVVLGGLVALPAGECAPDVSSGLASGGV